MFKVKEITFFRLYRYLLHMGHPTLKTNTIIPWDLELERKTTLREISLPLMVKL